MKALIKRCKMKISFDNTNIIYLSHHDCRKLQQFLFHHLKCDYLTIDGHGGRNMSNGILWWKNLVNKKSISYPHSVGLLYGTADFLGFKPDNDEWKTMLASFSKKYIR